MKRDVKSKGRKKNVTSGKSSGVYKRGDGLGSKRPTGSSNAYKDRKPSSQSSYSHSSNQSSNTPNYGSLFTSSQNQSGAQKNPGGFSFKRIITIAIIIIIAYFVLKSCMNIDLLGGMGTDNLSFDDTITTETTNGSNPVDFDGSSSSGSVDYTVSSDARSKYTDIVGNGEDVYTIMIYMCGSDLESKYGMATSDLQEMLYAEISNNVNIVVETGGASKWKNSVISSRTNQRYQITNDGLKLVQDNLGKRQMTDPDTLEDFIEYCETNYSADRYALIFWDHGGGSNQGFGHDEFFPRTTMSLAEIDDALTNADVKFDFVGFDACLMATYETAIMLDDHADYLIASEETEPAIGWYYTRWLTKLSENTSMSTVDIGKNIIDDFTKKCYEASPRDKTTLSIIDLAELSGTVPKAFNAFASSTGELIYSDDYKIVADARGYSREFGAPAQLDQIDLIHLAQNIGTDEAKELIDALAGSIKYNRTSSMMSNSNGLSIYFPYTTLSQMGDMLDTYEKIGMDRAYTDCIRGFANLEVGGQAISSGSANPLGSLMGSFMQGSGSQIVGDLLTSFIGSGGIGNLLGGSDNTDWVDTDTMLNNADYYEDNYVKPDAMELMEKDGGYVLRMSDEDWDRIQSVQLNIFFDDGEGYIDLGLDNVYEFDSDGDLKIQFEGTWIALNGQPVAYYFMEEEWQGNEYAIIGRVPALLNGELVDLIVAYTSDNYKGEVLGARLVYDDGTTAKGLIKLEDGDALDLICDYYTYDEVFDDSYLLGDRMIVSGDIEVSDVYIEYGRVLVTYLLTDMYNNTYWTPAVEYN